MAVEHPAEGRTTLRRASLRRCSRRSSRGRIGADGRRVPGHDRRSVAPMHEQRDVRAATAPLDLDHVEPAIVEGGPSSRCRCIRRRGRAHRRLGRVRRRRHWDPAFQAAGRRRAGAADARRRVPPEPACSSRVRCRSPVPLRMPPAVEGQWVRRQQLEVDPDSIQQYVAMAMAVVLLLHLLKPSLRIARLKREN